MQKKNIIKIFTFVITALLLVFAFSIRGKIIDVNAVGYTYDHKGKVIYSTDGFTVNQTPYIYSNLGLDEISDLGNPKDLFVYRDVRNNDETTVYLLDGGSKSESTSRPSTLYLLDDNLQLKVDGEFNSFYLNPQRVDEDGNYIFSDDNLKAIKNLKITVKVESGKTTTSIASEPLIAFTTDTDENGNKVNVYSETEKTSSADESDATLAKTTTNFGSVSDIRQYEKVRLYMNNATSVYRLYKTNTTPYTDYLYIADLGNNQVIVLDMDSYDPELKTYEIVKIVTSPVEELGSTTFKPKKVIADAAGRIYVICDNIYDGIMEFSVDGTFDRYIGTNYVTLSAWKIFWRNFETEAQLAQDKTIINTSFTAMTYKNNMIYTTSYALYNDAGALSNDNVMIKKINPSGTDVLRRNGYTKPKGDNTYFKSNDTNGTYGPSKLDAIAVNDYGVYTVVDSARGRLFTYDNEGNLLYISGTGGAGDTSNNTQIDKITNPVAVQYLGENVLVLDSRRQAIIIFEPTEIAQVINKAVECEYEGRSDGETLEDGTYIPGAYDYWKQVILLNSNYEYAYVGIGKHYLNNKEYKLALENFRLGYDKVYYGKAYKQYRDSIIKANFGWFMIVLFVLVVGTIVFKQVRKKKLGIKEEEMTGIGDE